MPKDLFGKILSPGLGSLIPSSRTMAFSSIAKPSRGIVMTSAYPQGNRQAKAVNKVIVNGLKKRLDDAKEKWIEELPHILWTLDYTS